MFRNLIFIEENIGFDRILKSILIRAWTETVICLSLSREASKIGGNMKNYFFQSIFGLILPKCFHYHFIRPKSRLFSNLFLMLSFKKNFNWYCDRIFWCNLGVELILIYLMLILWNWLQVDQLCPRKSWQGGKKRWKCLLPGCSGIDEVKTGCSVTGGKYITNDPTNIYLLLQKTFKS